jgi:transcription initiation factor TFIIIB Brf1 subunit/transcription initiation factor TFIIB
MKCQGCGSTDIVVDSAQGVKICAGCGTIVEKNAIVSEL